MNPLLFLGMVVWLAATILVAAIAWWLAVIVGIVGFLLLAYWRGTEMEGKSWDKF